MALPGDWEEADVNRVRQSPPQQPAPGEADTWGPQEGTGAWGAIPSDNSNKAGAWGPIPSDNSIKAGAWGPTPSDDSNKAGAWGPIPSDDSNKAVAWGATPSDNSNKDDKTTLPGAFPLLVKHGAHPWLYPFHPALVPTHNTPHGREQLGHVRGSDSEEDAIKNLQLPPAQFQNHRRPLLLEPFKPRPALAAQMGAVDARTEGRSRFQHRSGSGIQSEGHPRCDYRHAAADSKHSSHASRWVCSPADQHSYKQCWTLLLCHLSQVVGAACRSGESDFWQDLHQFSSTQQVHQQQGLSELHAFSPSSSRQPGMAAQDSLG